MNAARPLTPERSEEEPLDPISQIMRDPVTHLPCEPEHGPEAGIFAWALVSLFIWIAAGLVWEFWPQITQFFHG